MPYQKVENVDKQRIYDCFLRGEDYVPLAQQLGIKQSTAYAIIRRAERNDGVVNMPRGGRRRTLVSDELIQASIDIVERSPEFTLNQILTELRNVLPNHPRISRSTLANMLSGQLIVTKQLRDVPQERNTDATKNRRHDFAQWLMQEGVNHAEIIFIDESGINLWLKRTRGRAIRGQRALRTVGGQRGRNLTMTFAVSSRRGLIHHNLMEGGMNRQSFRDFLLNVVNGLPNDNAHRSLVFDNAPDHRFARDMVFDNQRVSLHFQPPYSPFFNICDLNSFSIWKAALKRELAAVRDQILAEDHQQKVAILAQLAEQSTAVITPENAQEAFRRMMSYVPNSLQRNDILF